MDSYLVLDSDILLAIFSPEEKHARLQSRIRDLLNVHSAYFIPFISLIWLEDKLVAALEGG